MFHSSRTFSRTNPRGNAMRRKQEAAEELRFDKPRKTQVWKSTQAKKSFLFEQLQSWFSRSTTRFKAIGLTKEQVKAVKSQFISSLAPILTPNGTSPHISFDWETVEKDLGNGSVREIDRALMRLFLRIVPKLSANFSHLEKIEEALNILHPSEWHPIARQVHRKFIFHVGPTNSGKTYHALRALAGAEYGLYAGPLRLLALEIFTRLNRGDIAPFGADTSILHPRACNLLTGEQQKIISPDAGLTSATVEMIPLTQKYDVVVLDEIQMISDPERGNAWTQAVLGLSAKEIHLCGEETAVDLVINLLKHTGDEVVVNRYERLTPLEVSPKSLENNLASIRPGDCVVAFSRKTIFNLKDIIEEKTGLRCAVAYGRLPPEVRSEQAALFNDSNDEYPIMVASDAIGMGLNLKIKRIIFTTLQKWDGNGLVLVSLSQIKQIAGRAGRYGMGTKEGGIVTTLLSSDRHILTLAMGTPTPPLTKAVLAPDNHALLKLQRALDPSAGLTHIYLLLSELGTCQEPYQMVELEQQIRSATLIDTFCPQLSIPTRALLTQVPLNWEDVEAMEAFKIILMKYSAGSVIEPSEIFREVGLLLYLEDVQDAQKEEQLRSLNGNEDTKPALSVREAGNRLKALELLHKLTVAYLWLSYRFPVAFARQAEANQIKEDTESGIQFCLELIRAKRGKSVERTFGRLEKVSREIDSRSKVHDINLNI